MRRFLTSILILTLYTFSFAQQNEVDDTCVSFDFSPIALTLGDTVCTDIQVTGFKNLLSFQFSFAFDDRALEFVECFGSTELRGFDCSTIVLQDNQPVFKVLWFEPQGNVTSLDSATQVASLCFNVLATDVEFDSLFMFTDDLESELTVGDPNDLSVATMTTLCVMEDITSSVFDLKSLTSVSVFPNPVRDELQIHTQDSEDLPVKAQIIDLQGKLVYQQAMNSQSEKLPLQDLNKGIYILHIDMTNGVRYSGKVMKID